MNELRIAAWLLVAWSGFNIVAGPFIIGQSNKTTAGGYVIQLVRCLLTIFLAGYIIGWW